MIANIPIEIVFKIIVTVLLVIVSIGGIAGYFYIDIRRLYQEKENRWWVGLLAIGLPIISFISGVVILMLWNPSARKVFWFLLLFIVGVSLILRESIVSPYEMADWWSQVGNWWKQKKKRRQ
jgi:hypothetical protein